MKQITILIAVLFFRCIIAVQNGQDVTNQNKYPFYIMIGNPHVCGGTLISYDPALVLTAAHCVDSPIHPTQYSKDKNPYFALYNDIHRDNQRAMAIVDWNIHPLYNVSGKIDIRYDAAIIQLESPLRKSARIKRIPLWSPSMSLSLPSKAELIGFGYSDLEGHLAQTLQLLPLEITGFNPNSTEHVESRSNAETHIACHGDSGGPLIVYHPMRNPFTNSTINIPYVLGDLTRIFGARDLKPDQLTCPIPINNHVDGRENSVTEVFTNAAGLLDWISEISGISAENLSNPFYTPPHPPCKNCRYKATGKTKTTASKPSNDSFYDAGDNEDDEMEDGDSGSSQRHPSWRIGVVAEENNLLDTEDAQHFWIGSVTRDFFVKAGAGESSSATGSLRSFDTFITLILFTILLAFF